MFVKKPGKDRRYLLPFLFILSLVLAACGGAAPSVDTVAAEPPADGEPANAETTQAPSDGGQAAGVCANPYFPVVVGATRVYASSSPDFGDFGYTETVSDVRADGFTLTTQFDELTRTQEWSCGSDGLAALEYSGGNSAAITTTGLQGSFTTTEMSGVTLPPSITPGATWNQSFTVEGVLDMGEAGQATAIGSAAATLEAIGVESVTVPAGTFNAMRIEVHTTVDMQASIMGMNVPVALESTTISWYAEGVGLVKSEDSASIEGTEAISTTTELQSYTVP